MITKRNTSSQVSPNVHFMCNISAADIIAKNHRSKDSCAYSKSEKIAAVSRGVRLLHFIQ